MSIGAQKKVDLMVRLGLPDLLRAMGCRSIDRVPSSIREQAENVLGQAGDLIRAQCVYTVHPVARMSETQIDLAECPPIVGPIASFLKPATRVAAYVLTVGDSYERKSRALMADGDMLDGYAWDAVASAAADLATDLLTQHLLTAEAGRDEAVTPPFSPGYCGMGLDQQKPLFAIVDAGSIGVSLSESMMMSPIKSVSGLLGIGPATEVIDRGVPCQWCELTTCHMRR